MNPRALCLLHHCSTTKPHPNIEVRRKKITGLMWRHKIKNLLNHQENIKISNVHATMMQFKFHAYLKNIGGILPNLFHAISIKHLSILNSLRKNDADQYILLVWKWKIFNKIFPNWIKIYKILILRNQDGFISEWKSCSMFKNELM
jgi:hypothetical protein